MSTEIEDEVEFRERIEKKLESLETQADRFQVFPTLNEDPGTSTGDASGSPTTFPIREPIFDRGTVGLTSESIDLEPVQGHIQLMRLDGNINIAINNPPGTDRSQEFLIQITQDATGGHTVGWPGSVIPVPAVDLTADAITRVRLRTVDGGTIYFSETIGVAGGGTLPSGTAENDHLEWDNSISVWKAVQTLTFGATGPFADSGFLKFANDQIMLSARNAADTGNYEVKVNASDILDLTRSDNGITTLQLRSQHATDPDQILAISQQSGTGGGSIFSNPNFYQWDVGATTLFTFDEPSSGQGRILGTVGLDKLQIAFESDTYLTGSGTPGRINVFSSGTNVFAFSTTGANLLGSASLFLNGGFIEFAGTAPTSGQVRYANDTIGMTWRGATGGNIEIKVDASNAFDFTRDDNGITNLKIRSQHATLADNILSISQQSGTGGGSIFNNPNFFQWDVGATTLFSFDEPVSGQGRIKHAGTPAFDRFQIAFEDDTYFTGSGTAGRLNVVSSGTNTFAFSTTGASFLGTSTNLFFNGGYIQQLERAGDPTSVTNTVQLYVKDVGGDSHLFARYDTVASSTVVDIIAGLGGGTSSFADDVFDVHDNVTPAKIFQFTLGGMANGTTVFDINNSTPRIYTFPDKTGTVAFINQVQTWTADQTFTADLLSDGLNNLGTTANPWNNIVSDNTLFCSNLKVFSTDSNINVFNDLDMQSGDTIDFADTATSAGAGARTLPSNPVDFIIIKVNGVSRRVPFYAT